MVIFPNGAERRLMENMFSKAAITSHSLRLFQNNLTPDANTVAADFTVATFSGYANIVITPSNYSSAVTLDGKAYMTHATQTFTKTGATTNNIYGWYLLDNSSNLLACERDPSAPVSMSVDGDKYFVSLAYRLADLNS